MQFNMPILSKPQRLGIGILVLLLVDVIWVSSSELTKYLFKNENYSKPYFSTYLKTSMFIIYLFGFVIWRPWREQCRRVLPTVQHVDPNQEVNEVLVNDESTISDPLYLPIKFHGGDKSSGTESDDPMSTLGKARAVRFSKLTEVRQLSESQAEDAMLARLSYTASLRAHELALRLANKLSVKQVAKIAALFSGVWFLGNLAYQEALANTEAGVVNALSSSSGLFTLLLAAAFPATHTDRFTLSKLVAVVISMAGVILVSVSDLSFEARLPSGAMWALLGSLCYATYLVLLRKKVDSEDKMDIPMFFGFVGLFCFLTLWPGIFVLHYTGLETLEWPTTRQFLVLTVNGLVGTVFSEFLWLWGCFFTSSLVATLSLSLTIPMTLLADILMKEVEFNRLFFLGTVPTFIAFFATSLLTHYENWDPVMEGIRRLLHFTCYRKRAARLREVDREQTESLIGINSNDEHDA